MRLNIIGGILNFIWFDPYKPKKAIIIDAPNSHFPIHQILIDIS